MGSKNVLLFIEIIRNSIRILKTQHIKEKMWDGAKLWI